MTTQTFNPPPEDVPRILDDLASPNCSLREIAEAYDTTIDGLTLWLARPDIAERFAAAESFAARRVRHAAACQLPAAVRAATHILDLFNHAAERRQLDDLTPAIQRNSAHAAAGLTNTLPPRLAALELQRRICETARKAANLLARLARFEHGPPRPRPTPATDHAAPVREPQSAPQPNAPPAPATHTAPNPQHHSAPIASPTPTPETAPPTASPLCELRASARNSSEDPATPSGSPTAADSASHAHADLFRRAEAYAQSIDAPDPSDDEIDALIHALETGDTAGLPPEIAERFESVKARGRLPTAADLLASFMPCDTS